MEEEIFSLEHFSLWFESLIPDTNLYDVLWIMQTLFLWLFLLVLWK